MIRNLSLMVVSALLITLLMPRRAVMEVRFTPGEIWGEETLVAPFDVPIYKDPEQLVFERKALLEGFQPLFRMDTAVGRTQLRELEADLNGRWVLTPQERAAVLGAFHHIYSTGLVTDADRSPYIGRLVRIDSAHLLRTVPAVELYTPVTAQEYLIHQQVGVPEQYARYLVPSLIYDQTINAKLREQVLVKLSTTEGVLHSGEIIVAHGQMVDSRIAHLLDSYRNEYGLRLGEGGSGWVLLLGRYLILLAILGASFVFFQYLTPQPLFENWRAMLFVFVLYLLMAIFMGIVARTPYLSPYIVPLPVAALLLLAFFNTRVAVFGNIMVTLMAALFVRYSFEFFTVNLLGGIAAVFIARHHYQRHIIFKAVGAALLVGVVIYCSFQWVSTGTLHIRYASAIWLLGSALLTLAFYQLVYIFERIFGFVSDITLLELSDTNQPLLLQLAEKAPGTFQHSVQVASLAEAAAKEIGANPLLARTGALYHDIGKLKNPYYFIENQMGSFNPHSTLTPQESAAIVRAHITDGVAMVRKNRLPAVIQDFIAEHHGTSKIYYFYARELELHGRVEHPEEFTYPGPNPVRREVAICMMADAVEAASRSLQSYDRAAIDGLVDRIVDTQIAEHRFSQVMLSFAEVTRIKELFKIRLNNIYHSRVAYPEGLE